MTCFKLIPRMLNLNEKKGLWVFCSRWSWGLGLWTCSSVQQLWVRHFWEVSYNVKSWGLCTHRHWLGKHTCRPSRLCWSWVISVGENRNLKVRSDARSLMDVVSHGMWFLASLELWEAEQEKWGEHTAQVETLSNWGISSLPMARGAGNKPVC